MSIAEKEQLIIDEFASLDEWFDRYEKIIEAGKSAPPIPAEYKTSEHAIKGCQSTVWIHTEEQDGRMCIWGDSDALITKGILSLIIRVLDGEPKEDVASAELPFLDTIGLRTHLSPSRTNGLTVILQRIQQGSDSGQ